jgi:hypothetical protein
LSIVPTETESGLPRILCSRREAGQILGGRSPSSIDYLIAAGKIQAKRDGKRVLPVIQSVVDYARTLPDAELNPAPRNKQTEAA